MSTHNKILDLQALLHQRAEWKKEGLKVVFTNGCFDILHLGHVDYLERAAQLGDCLIVAINNDQSVQMLKGASRPILDEHARSRIIAALQFVDAVVLFGESTPEALIRQIIPDILVKGSDYQKSNIVGEQFVEQNGGMVEMIQLVKGYSTTRIIEKMKDAID